jgi:energy-coupling factor transport system substrate-specific component
MTTTTSQSSATPRNAAIKLRSRSALIIALISLVGLAMFCWPLIIPASASPVQHAHDGPMMFALILPLLLVLAWAGISDGAIDVKALGLLGVLSAINAVLRPLGSGVAGFEPMSFFFIVAGRVFGPGFGFIFGCTSLVASALLTAGVGPWLPFQMLASAWVSMGAGLLPDRIGKHPIRGWKEITLLSVYGIISAYAFGLIMNLWFWPYIAGSTMGDQASLAYIPGGPLTDNLTHFLAYSLISSTAIWDTGRAITDVVALIILGPPVLTILRRAARRAQFDPVVEFVR